ncbi:MAG: hypothetical protein LBG98_01215, partial [Puniceicoccales bacterium]|nr:hypothetical protein [Puniceicoccales bacterium]
ISEIFLCGDCRPYHQNIIPICKELSISVWVFEEGYLRPNCITLEKWGVNALSQDYEKPLQGLQPSLPLPRILPCSHHRTVLFPFLLSIRYYTFIAFGIFDSKLHFVLQKIYTFFSRKSHSKEKNPLKEKFLYQHYRSLSLKEILYFTRSFLRKVIYVKKEHDIRKKLRQLDRPRLFVVPLQIVNDSQITRHSDFPNMEAFIMEVIRSFSKAAPADTYIVFKHHPLNRGHCHYGAYIRHLVQQFHMDPQRILYVHTTPLSFFWPKTLGCVTINSTSGFNALQNGIPTICLGRCLYNRQGITHTGSLDDFWMRPEKPQMAKIRQLEHYWKSHVLIQASFYHPLQHNLWDCIPSHLREQLELRCNRDQNIDTSH